MSGGPAFAQLVGLAAMVGVAVLIGFWTALQLQASPRLLSLCVGGIMGIIPGTILFEFLPALSVTADSVLPMLGLATLGFLVAAVVHGLVQVGLPDRQAPGEAEMGSAILAVMTDDVVEGFTLAFSGILSLQVLLFTTMAFILKNVLEGFTEATVLRWQGRSKRRIWSAGIAAATAVLVAAAAAGWLAGSDALAEGTRRPLFAAIIGALLYVSVFDLALHLEWNSTQKVAAPAGFLATGAVSLLVG